MGMCPTSCKRFGVKKARGQDLWSKKEGVWAKNAFCTKRAFSWAKKNSSCAYSLKNENHPRLPLFTRKGPAGSTALLNPVFWLIFDKLSSWRICAAAIL